MEDELKKYKDALELAIDWIDSTPYNERTAAECLEDIDLILKEEN
jgi:hypothetical protein